MLNVKWRMENGEWRMENGEMKHGIYYFTISLFTISPSSVQHQRSIKHIPPADGWWRVAFRDEVR